MLSIIKKLRLFYLLNKGAQPIKHFLKNQKGAIFVFFLIMFSVFLILIYATFEYCRLINEKIKTEQVLEQTSLILTAEDNGDTSGTPEDRNRFLARSHIESFIPSTTATNESIEIISPNQNDLKRKYTITLRNAYSSIFNLFSTMSVSGKAAAQKEYQEEPMDVVFVFSFYRHTIENPLRMSWETREEINELKTLLIKKINIILEMNPLNKVGFVPFSWGVKEGRYCLQPFVFLFKPNYYNINFGPAQFKAPRQTEVISKSIDFVKTVNNIPFAMTDSNVISLASLDNRLCGLSLYRDPIPLTREKNEIFMIINDEFIPGYNLISSGILSGVKLLSRGTNSKKLLIIISDTEEAPPMAINDDNKRMLRIRFNNNTLNISESLIKEGMCEKIKNSGIKMYFISTGGSIESYNYWKTQCIGEKNMHNYNNLNNVDDELKQILQASGDDPVGTNVVH